MRRNSLSTPISQSSSPPPSSRVSSAPTGPHSQLNSSATSSVGNATASHQASAPPPGDSRSIKR